MRKRSFFIAAVFLFLLTTRSVCYSAEAIKLRYSQYFPPTLGPPSSPPSSAKRSKSVQTEGSI